jgi:hypothetical protein
MNIYQLDKSATPGPLELNCEFNEPRYSLISRGNVGERFIVALVYDKKDAVRLLHCVNHFMEALEGLKDAMKCPGPDQGYARALRLQKLVLKLETVEIA